MVVEQFLTHQINLCHLKINIAINHDINWLNEVYISFGSFTIDFLH